MVRRLTSCARAAVAALLLLAATARGATTDELEATTLAAIEKAQAAALLMDEPDRAGAVAAMDESIALADAGAAAAAETDTQESLGRKAKAVAKGLAKFAERLRAVRESMADEAVAPQKAVDSLKKPLRDALKNVAKLRRLPLLGVAIFEQNAKSGGFHKPGEIVEFRLVPGVDPEGLPCDETPVVQVVAADADVVSEPLLLGGGRVSVVFGTKVGAARIESTACGVTRRWMLFNLGPLGTFETAVPYTGNGFDGIYDGPVDGSDTLYYPPDPVPEINERHTSVRFEVAQGQVTVTYPGTATGRLLSDGRVDFTLVAFGAVYHYEGRITRVLTRLRAAGTWTAEYAHPDGIWNGTGGGTWSAVREDSD